MGILTPILLNAIATSDGFQIPFIFLETPNAYIIVFLFCSPKTKTQPGTITKFMVAHDKLGVLGPALFLNVYSSKSYGWMLSCKFPFIIMASFLYRTNSDIKGYWQVSILSKLKHNNVIKSQVIQTRKGKLIRTI